MSGNNPTVEGFVDAVRFAWTVHLLLIHDMVDAREAVPSASPKDLDHLQSCLEVIFSHNAFQFMLQEVIQTAAYQVFIFYVISNYCASYKQQNIFFLDS